MPTNRRYDLIALDLDGTVLDGRGRVSSANRAAIERARQAGVRITVCTGRGLVESGEALRAIGQVDPVVVAGGAIIACPCTGGTRHRFAVERDLVHRSVEALLGHGHAALILKDPVAAGYDYLVVRGREGIALDPVTQWWFEAMKVKVRYAATVLEDEHPEHTVRVGACGRARVCEAMTKSIESIAGGKAVIHHFPAVVAPDAAAVLDDGDRLHVLEMFHADANKWSAIRVLAEGWGIERERIAAMGDQINDVSMLEGAGLGVAMGNAVPAARAAADRVTGTNDEDGVAQAIERILDGSW